LLQFGILLVRDVDEVAASAPRPNTALKLWHVLRVAAQNKRAQAIQCCEVVVAVVGTNDGLAIGLYEVNAPQVFVLLEVQQDAGHGGILGQLPVFVRALVVDGNWSARDCVHVFHQRNVRSPRLRRYRLFAMPSCNIEATLWTHVEFAQAALERQRGLRFSTQTAAYGDLHAAEMSGEDTNQLVLSARES
jgi:hypothetical protein